MEPDPQSGAAEDRPPKCIVCRATRTFDTYELGHAELDTLVRERRVYRAARVHAKYGAVPICAPCLAALGFVVEGRPPDGASPPLVTIRRRT